MRKKKKKKKRKRKRKRKREEMDQRKDSFVHRVFTDLCDYC